MKFMRTMLEKRKKEGRKIMETWEMIKELTKHPEKVFQVELKEHLVCYVDKEDDTIRFVNKIVSKRDGERAEFPLELGDKWEEVK